MSEKRPHLVPAAISAVLLLGALGSWPYGYYVFLRWVVCISAGFIAFKSYEWKRLWAVWLFGFIALLFNPLVPIYLSKELWQPIDLICAILFIVTAVIMKKPVK